MPLLKEPDGLYSTKPLVCRFILSILLNKPSKFIKIEEVAKNSSINSNHRKSLKHILLPLCNQRQTHRGYVCICIILYFD